MRGSMWKNTGALIVGMRFWGKFYDESIDNKGPQKGIGTYSGPYMTA